MNGCGIVLGGNVGIVFNGHFICCKFSISSRICIYLRVNCYELLCIGRVGCVRLQILLSIHIDSANRLKISTFKVSYFSFLASRQI